MFSLIFLKRFVVLSTVFTAAAVSQSVALNPENLIPLNVDIKTVQWKGSEAVKLTELDDNRESIAIVRQSDFLNGTIELEVAGLPRASAGASARGFIGIAFRVQNSDTARYECFYLRPTNGRAKEQIRRNHSIQYISHPAYPWYRLRGESPGVYESYVDLVPGEWTKMKVVVQQHRAMLFVHDAPQPSLIVNDVKQSGGPGTVALWIGMGTEGYFKNLRITPAATE
jgi:hypothetical protein